MSSSAHMLAGSAMPSVGPKTEFQKCIGHMGVVASESGGVMTKDVFLSFVKLHSDIFWSATDEICYVNVC